MGRRLQTVEELTRDAMLVACNDLERALEIVKNVKVESVGAEEVKAASARSLEFKIMIRDWARSKP